MAAVPVTIVGVAYLTDVGVGGGPIYPPSGGQPPGNPPGIWGGGNVPMPTPPIANVPGAPGYNPPGSPPGIWGPPGPWPTPPIAFPPGWVGGQPPGIWGGGNVPMPTPPIYLPPLPPGYPAHPIYWPPGIWGGGNVPMPTPPIANVPGAPGYNPPGIWPGPGPIYPVEPHPEHPIALPPEGPPTEPPVDPPTNPPSTDWEWGWSPSQGWHPVYVPGDKPSPVPPGP